MAAGVELATAYVTLAVESSAIGEAIGKGFAGGDKVATKAGRNMGRAMAKGFEQEDPGASLETLRKDVEAAQAKIAAATERSAREQAAATRKVEIARAELTAAEAKGEAGRVAAMKAADRLAIAEQKLEASTMKARQESQKLHHALDDAEQAFGDLEEQMQEAAQAAEKSSSGIRGAFAGVGAAIKKGMSGDLDGAFEDARGAAGGAAEDVRSKFATAGSAAKSALSGDLKGAFDTIRPAASAAADDVEQEFRQAGEPAGSGFMDDFGGALKVGVGALGGLGLGLSVMEGFTSGMERERLGDRLSAQLNLAGPDAERAGQVAGSLYSGAWGESMDDTHDAVATVMSSLPGMMDAPAEKLESTTAKALDLATAFDVDMNEAVGAVGVMMRNGLAKDADAAFDLMVGGMQKVPAGFRDELMPAMTEYSKHFGALGMDGATAMGLLVRGAENGTIGVDKMGDAVKEFQIRSTDMSKATGEAYDTIGLDMDDMTTKLLAGGDEAEEAFGQIIHGLQGIDDPAEQSAASLALFGTPLEDMSVDQIPEFLGMMDPAGDAFDDFGGAAERMGNTLNDNAATNLEAFKRQLSTGFTEVVGTAAGHLLDFGSAFEPVLSFLKETAPQWTPFATGIGLVAGAVLVWKGATALLASGLWGQAAALAAAYAPITAIVIGVGLLVGAVIWAWQNVEWFREGVLGAWEWIKTSTAALVDWWTGTAWPAVISGLQTVGGWFTWLWQNVMLPVWDAIKFIVAVAVGTLLTLWDGLVWVVQNVLGPIFTWLWQSVLVPVWNGIVGVVRWAWNVVIAPLFRAVVGFVRDVLGPAFSHLWHGVLVPAWQGIVSVVSWAWNVVIAPMFRAIRGFVVDRLGPAFSWLWHNAIKPAWDGISGLIRTGWGAIRDRAFEPMRKFVTETIPSAFDRAQQAVGKAWSKLKGAVADPVEFVVNDIIRDGLIDNINSVLRKVGLKDKQIDFGGVDLGGWKSTGGSFATGGYTGPGGKYEPAGVVHRDEFVLRKEAQRDIAHTAPGLLEAMNRFGAAALPFAGSGSVAGLTDPARMAPGAALPSYGGMSSWAGSPRAAIYSSGVMNVAGGAPGYDMNGAIAMLDRATRVKVKRGPGLQPNSVHVTSGNYADWWAGYNSGQQVWLNNRIAGGMPLRSKRVLLAHELGHAMGLPHNARQHGGNGAASMMNYDNMYSHASVTQADVAALSAIYGGSGFASGGGDGGEANPFLGVFGGLSKLWDKLTGDGFAVELAKGVGKYLAGALRGWVTDKLPFGGDNDDEGSAVAPALYDGGGMLHEGVQLVEHRRRKPDRVLSAEQWDALYTTADSVRDGGTGTQVNVTVPERADMDPGQFGRRVGEAIAFEVAEVAGL